jgi:hypothetical protein
MARKTLLIVYPDGHSHDIRVDNSACWPLLLFLESLAVSALWYAYVYGTEGTDSPSWIGIFG